MNDLASIRQVADHFDLPISTLHYWERRGLITPYRHFGHRHYNADQIYRIALIRLWRATGQMSLDEIAAVLSERPDTSGWRETVTARIAAIEAQLTQLDTARSYLRGLLECRHDDALEHCEGFRAQVTLPAKNHQ
ncbi:MerR family transcriptional regulator [Streptomyces rectiverticillatus]|uniref:helix-turn-helix domain-containing protein n=1 Tax=Streptomyces rectiverticillatus TaxID=173860 RepID=UPI0015C40501|nr:MerR family transcriptional regulator [Streptomyces rectiverticillatus]QLE70225.1 MerR family transcriptional regulator [Streptomyces rectiverticillatus]QLE75775.1 MerR family transcriptional regulator [Streptomyces rectiverticillatus]